MEKQDFNNKLHDFSSQLDELAEKALKAMRDQQAQAEKAIDNLNDSELKALLRQSLQNAMKAAQEGRPFEATKMINRIQKVMQDAHNDES